MPAPPRRSAHPATLLATALLALGLGLGGPLVPGAAAKKPMGQELVPRLKAPEIVEALRQGGHVILLRHMTTEPAGTDPAAALLDDCETQRNLSAKGRQQAELLGKSFEKLGIPVGEALSSPFCRCVETGTLAFGKVTKSELLSLGDAYHVEGQVDRGAELRKLLDTPPSKPGTNTVLITHTSNLLYTFGLNPRPEGVAHVFKPTGIGVPSYLGMVTPEEWVELAGLESAEPQP